MRFDLFLQTLPVMLQGMLGIFAVMLLIYLVIVALGRVTKKDSES